MEGKGWGISMCGVSVRDVNRNRDCGSRHRKGYNLLLGEEVRRRRGVEVSFDPNRERESFMGSLM